MPPGQLCCVATVRRSTLTGGTSMQSVVLAKLAAIALAVEGSGNIKEESRNVGDFSSVSVQQGVSANISVGSKRSVTVSADDNLLPLVRTDVDNGRLIIGLSQGNIRSSGTIRVNVTTPELKAVAASGGSAVSVEGTTGSTFDVEGSGGGVLTVNKAKADQIKASASGGARVTLSGAANELKVHMSGGAGIKAM